MIVSFNKKIYLSWLWVILCSVAIFVTIPIARTIQKYISSSWGRKSFIYFVLFVLLLGFFGLFYLLISKLKIRSGKNYVWLFVVTGLYVYFTLKLWDIPEEAIHFLEYGLLSFFLYKALIHHIKDKSIYFTATFFGILIGTFDEIIQWAIPQRVWNFDDVWLNGLSVGLFQLAIWKVVRPKILSEKFNAKSLKILTSISALCLIILGLCVSNTPQRVSAYTAKIPWLSFLQKEEPMSEFGYKYKDSEVGIFYSRLSPTRLKKTDELMGKAYAQILNESATKDYQQFLREYNPIVNSFLHECRIHVFRRDRYFKRANRASNLNTKRNYYFIAYKENLILQKYFTQTIENSIYHWGDSQIEKSGVIIEKEKSYESPVSANLFTSFTEKDIWLSIFALLSLLVLVNLIFPLLRN